MTTEMWQESKEDWEKTEPTGINTDHVLGAEAGFCHPQFFRVYLWINTAPWSDVFMKKNKVLSSAA